MDSIGATGECLLIACLSPSSKFVDESVNTLSFASKAANIQKRDVVVLSAHEQELQRLNQIIEKLRDERDQWKTEAGQLKSSLLANNVALPEGLVLSLQQ
jgi:hypothetical protein